MTTVVDASVVVDWVAPDVDHAGPAGKLLTSLAASAEPLVAPVLLLHEVGNALLTGIRRQRWTGEQADAAYGALTRIPVEFSTLEVDSHEAFELSRRYDEHPLYDMVYLAVAVRRSATLVTADRRFLARVGHLPFVIGVETH